MWELHNGALRAWYEDDLDELEEYESKRPTVDAEYRDVWDAFLVLHAARSHGWGPNPISVSDRQSYYRMYRIGPADIDDFDAVIRRVDAAYLKHHAETEKARAKKT